jgi:hypothetical protein
MSIETSTASLGHSQYRRQQHTLADSTMHHLVYSNFVIVKSEARVKYTQKVFWGREE